MGYTPEQLNDAKEKRKKLEDLIAYRLEQEKIWKANNERIFVPTDINFDDISGNTQLDYAVMLGDINKIRSLVENGAKSNHALNFAFKSGHSEIVQFLLDKGFEYDPVTAATQCDEACRSLLVKDLKARFQKDLEAILQMDAKSTLQREDPSASPPALALRAANAKATLLHYGALMPYADFKELMGSIPETRIDLKTAINEPDVIPSDTITDKSIFSTPLAYAIKAW